MAILTVYFLKGAVCPDCKKKIPEIFTRHTIFIEKGKCKKCQREFDAKTMVNDLGVKVELKEFNSDKLYKEILDQYVKRNFSVENANEMAQKVVAREYSRFQEKYGFNQKQSTLA